MLTIHQLIPGLWQGDHGLLELAEKLIDNGHTSKRERVLMYEWKTDWSAHADMIRHLMLYLRQPHLRLNIYAYSWGAGWGAMELARQLHRLALRVDSMVLADPVYRHPLPLRNWRALLPHEGWGFIKPPKIHVPWNVDQVHVFYQRQDAPQGHALATKDVTLLHEPAILELPHVAMDQSPQFHERCLAIAAEKAGA